MLRESETLLNGVRQATKYNLVTQWGEEWWFGHCVDGKIGPFCHLRVKHVLRNPWNLWFPHISSQFSWGNYWLCDITRRCSLATNDPNHIWEIALPAYERKWVFPWSEMQGNGKFHGFLGQMLALFIIGFDINMLVLYNVQLIDGNAFTYSQLVLADLTNICNDKLVKWTSFLLSLFF